MGRLLEHYLCPRGVQLLDETRVILGNQKGELKDHFISLSQKDLDDPNTNICAGIRWLFHKKHLASHKLKRTATWKEAVAEFKSLQKDLERGDERAKELMKRFVAQLEKYEKCKL